MVGIVVRWAAGEVHEPQCGWSFTWKQADLSFSRNHFQVGKVTVTMVITTNWALGIHHCKNLTKNIEVQTSTTVLLTRSSFREMHKHMQAPCSPSIEVLHLPLKKRTIMHKSDSAKSSLVVVTPLPFEPHPFFGHFSQTHH